MTTRAAKLRRRALAAVRDPWVLLSAGIGGGLAWAVGIPPALDVTTAAVMLASATGISMFVGGGGDADGFDDDDDATPRLRSGTRQAQLVAVLEGYLADLRKMHGSKLPEAVTNSTIEALVAADGARRAARRVAVAVDGLDGAIERARQVAGSVGGSGKQVRASLQRMTNRREALLVKLDSAVGEVAEVYTKLLELSATVDTLDLTDGDGSVSEVNKSLDGLRTAFAELEADATSTPGLP